jgi:hypothetical protein
MHVVKPHQSSDRFDEFWKAYPKHIGKPLARAKWDSITNGGLTTRTLDKDSGTYVQLKLKGDPEEIIAAARRYNKRQTDKQTYKIKEYTCNPATWLNQGRWMDD